MNPITLLVVAKPNLRCLRLLERLPDSTRIVAGDTPEAFAEAAASADVLFPVLSPKAVTREVFLQCSQLRWVHSFSAGLEGVLFPELIESPVIVTNGRGVFASSLAEFVIAGILFFEKNFRHLLKAQAGHKWDQKDISELRGKTMGVVGYGKIGQAAARLAKAFGVRIFALRKRPELAADDPVIDRVFTPDQIRQMIAASDYIVAAAPLTDETRGLIGPAEIAAMKPNAIFANVGRGAVVDEPALIEALKENRIRGAALDVFCVEPLPADSPFFQLENVLLSPHCADHTPVWMEDAMEMFLANFDLFARGQPLENVVDLRNGY